MSQDTTFLGEPQTPVIQPLKNQGHQGGEFFFIKKSLLVEGGGKPVLIGFLHGKNEDFDTHGEKARSVLFDDLANALQRNGVASTAEPAMIGQKNSRDQLLALMEKTGSKKALLVNLNAALIKQRTLLWNALMKIEARVQVFELKNGELHTGPSITLSPQKLPIRKWIETTEYKQQKYEEVSKKLTAMYSKTDLAAYIRSSLL